MGILICVHLRSSAFNLVFKCEKDDMIEGFDSMRAPRVTPLVAMLAGEAGHFEAARPALEKMLGPVELVSELFEFNPTEYYTASMGAGLKRCFFGFQNF